MKEWLKAKKEQIENHWRRRKPVYITIGVCGITGAAFIVGRNVGMRQALAGWTEVWVPRYPGGGNPVRNVKYPNVVFRTQVQASQMYRIPENVLSGHLRGKFPDVDGEVFEYVKLKFFAKPE